MAARLLLTLLALLTGLAAQNTTAQARIRADGANPVGAIATVQQSERTAVVRVSRPVSLIEGRWSQYPATMAMAFGRAVAHRAPAVLLRIDRARE